MSVGTNYILIVPVDSLLFDNIQVHKKKRATTTMMNKPRKNSLIFSLATASYVKFYYSISYTLK